MVKIVLTPEWFLGGDVLIELFSFAILFIFFLLSLRSYKISKNRNTLHLGIGFFLIAIAEFSTILTKLVLFYDFLFAQQIGQVIIAYKVLKSVDVFYYLGFFLHKLFTLLGLYVIYRIPLKRKYSTDFLLMICFIAISAMLSSTYEYVFNLIAFVLLIFIINNYWQIYKKNKSENTKILMIAFVVLALSQIMFIMPKLDDFSSIIQIKPNNLHVIGQIAQLVSYLILLFLIIRILKTQYGRQKEKQDRNNLRYPWNNTRKRR